MLSTDILFSLLLIIQPPAQCSGTKNSLSLIINSTDGNPGSNKKGKSDEYKEEYEEVMKLVKTL